MLSSLCNRACPLSVCVRLARRRRRRREITSVEEATSLGLSERLRSRVYVETVRYVETVLSVQSILVYRRCGTQRTAPVAAPLAPPRAIPQGPTASHKRVRTHCLARQLQAKTQGLWTTKAILNRVTHPKRLAALTMQRVARVGCSQRGRPGPGFLWKPLERPSEVFSARTRAHGVDRSTASGGEAGYVADAAQEAVEEETSELLQELQRVAKEARCGS